MSTAVAPPTATDNKKPAVKHMTREKLQKLAEKEQGSMGGFRRPRKAVRKPGTADDKKLQTNLKRLGLNSIAGIEEVNLFKDDGTVIHFTNPKELQELLPGIINQLGSDNLANLKKLAEQFTKKDESGAPTIDDDVPDLVENFEEASQK